MRPNRPLEEWPYSSRWDSELKFAAEWPMGRRMWREFIAEAEKGEEPFSAVCARFGVSRKTGYKWLNRFRAEGEAGLLEQSRRPKTSPRKTPEPVADLVLGLRRENPEWSTARICAELKEQGVTPMPAPSTVDVIIRRRREQAAQQAEALGAHPDRLRFEPNYRWTLRLGREVRLAGNACTVVALQDDTTHFFVAASVVASARRVEAILEWVEQIFRKHGLPWRVALSAPRTHSPLTVWLMRAGVAVDFVEESAQEGSGNAQLAERLAQLPSYQRAALQARLAKSDWLDAFYRSRGLTEKSAVTLLDQLREIHNYGGSPGALHRTPSSLYRPSARLLPEELPELNYDAEADVRLVSEKGIFTFQRRLVHVGRAFAGLTVELKSTLSADHYVVLFVGQVLGHVDLSAADRDETTSLPLEVL